MDEPTDDMAVAAATDKKRIGFLDLSAELRNNIYELSLAIPTTKCIIRCYNTDPKNPLPVPRLPGHQRRHPRSNEQAQRLSSRLSATYRAVNGGAPSNEQAQRLSPLLLATCRTIHDEATPVLYGSQHFSLSLAGPFDPTSPWICDISDSFQYVRHFTLERALTQKDSLNILKVLRTATSIDTLLVNRLCSENFFNPKIMANALYPLIRKIHQARKDTGKKQALEVLQFEAIEKKVFVRNGMPYYIENTDSIVVKNILRKRLQKARLGKGRETSG